MESPRLLALVLVSTSISSPPAGIQHAVVQRTLGSVRLSIFVQIVSIVHADLLLPGICVDLALLVGVVATDERVEWTREEFASQPVLRSINGLALAVFWLGVRNSWWCWWDRDVGLVVSVRGSDDDLELRASLAGVGCGGIVDAATPKRALEGCHGGGVGALRSD